MLSSPCRSAGTTGSSRGAYRPGIVDNAEVMPHITPRTVDPVPNRARTRRWRPRRDLGRMRAGASKAIAAAGIYAEDIGWFSSRRPSPT